MCLLQCAAPSSHCAAPLCCQYLQGHCLTVLPHCTACLLYCLTVLPACMSCRRAVAEHKPKIGFLTSPNNPDGSVISEEDLLQVRACCITAATRPAAQPPPKGCHSCPCSWNGCPCSCYGLPGSTLPLPAAVALNNESCHSLVIHVNAEYLRQPCMAGCGSSAPLHIQGTYASARVDISLLLHQLSKCDHFGSRLSLPRQKAGQSCSSASSTSCGV